MKNTHVYFAIPTRGNDLYWRLVVYLLEQKAAFSKMSLGFAINGWQASTEDLFQHIISSDAEYIQWIDADIGPASGTTQQLVERDVDIITAPVWMYDPKTNDIHLNVLSDFKRESRMYRPKRSGIEQVAQCSFSMLLISRNVIDAFRRAGESFCKWSPFIHKSWQVMPPDVIFCRKAQKLGLKIFVDWEVKPAEHHKYVSLSENTVEQFFVNRIKDIDELKGHTGTLGSENGRHGRERFPVLAEH